MGEWTTLGACLPGDLVEARDGRLCVRQFTASAMTINCVLLALGTNIGLPRDTEVRRIDLRFLLAAAADRLQEHDAYQRGLRDGAATMRERAAATVDRMVDESPEPVDIGCANAIRHLELGEV